MCLSTREVTPRIAENDIECYKILIPVDGKLMTPYRDFIFNTNVVTVDKAEEDITEVFPGIYTVTSGFFHSCTSKDRVLEEVRVLQRKLPKGTKMKVFKAIIPKGTPYYIGMRSDMCSKALMIVE